MTSTRGLDLMMPDLGGGRVLAEVRVDPTPAATAVVVVTGEVDEAVRMGQLLGERSVFVKPSVVAELLHRVATLTGGPPL